MQDLQDLRDLQDLQDLHGLGLSLFDLRNVAKEFGIKGYNSMNKITLLRKLEKPIMSYKNPVQEERKRANKLNEYYKQLSD